MFGFFKDKLKDIVTKFSKTVEEEVVEDDFNSEEYYEKELKVKDEEKQSEDKKKPIETKKEIKQEIKQDTKKEEIKQEIKQDTKKEEIKQEIKKEEKIEVKNKEIKTKKPEFVEKPKVEDKSKEDSDQENKQKIKDKIKQEFRDQIYKKYNILSGDKKNNSKDNEDIIEIKDTDLGDNKSDIIETKKEHEIKTLNIDIDENLKDEISNEAKEELKQEIKGDDALNEKIDNFDENLFDSVDEGKHISYDENKSFFDKIKEKLFTSKKENILETNSVEKEKEILENNLLKEKEQSESKKLEIEHEFEELEQKIEKQPEIQEETQEVKEEIKEIIEEKKIEDKQQIHDEIKPELKEEKLEVKENIQKEIKEEKVEPIIEEKIETVIKQKVEHVQVKKEEPGFFNKIKDVFVKKTLSDDKFEELFFSLELALLENNVALSVIDKIKLDLKTRLVDKKLNRFQIDKTISISLKESISDLFNIPTINIMEEIKNKKNETGEPYIISFVGINGVGKTTNLAKLANYFKKNGFSVIMVAGDTFRVAAIEQIEEHANNLDIKLIKHDYGSDPAAVCFDAIKHAKSKNIDVVLIDTAGRSNANINLMNELKKVIRISKSDLKIFVGDSLSGNDAVEQAENFNESVGIDGVILAKSDADEKGGTAISIGWVLKKPILFLGTGQSYDDLKEFSSNLILDNLGLN